MPREACAAGREFATGHHPNPVSYGQRARGGRQFAPYPFSGEVVDFRRRSRPMDPMPGREAPTERIAPPLLSGWSMMTSTNPGADPESAYGKSELSPTQLRSEMRQVIALTWALTTVLSAIFLTITVLLLGGLMPTDQTRSARMSAVAGLACAGAAALAIGSALVVATRKRLTRVSDVYQEALA